MDSTQHSEGEFNIYVRGHPGGNPLMKSSWDMTEQLSQEAVNFLNKIGYKPHLYIPPPGFGAAATLLGTMASIKAILPVLKVGIFMIKVLSNKYILHEVNWSKRKRDNMSVCVSYTCDSRHWIADWDPNKASTKLDTMLDAAHYAAIYLSQEYPNIDFHEYVEFEFSEGKSSQAYSLSSSHSSDINIARCKRLFRYTTFEKDTEKTYFFKNKIFIKRMDKYKFSKRNKTYYFVIPSILLYELFRKYEIINRKVNNWS